MTYAVVELSLHAVKHFRMRVCLSLFLLSVSLSSGVLLRCVWFLSDIQEVRSQFLQLTAGNAHHYSIKGRRPIEETYPWNWSNSLENKKVYSGKCRNTNLKRWWIKKHTKWFSKIYFTDCNTKYYFPINSYIYLQADIQKKRIFLLLLESTRSNRIKRCYHKKLLWFSSALHKHIKMNPVYTVTALRDWTVTHENITSDLSRIQEWTIRNSSLVARKQKWTTIGVALQQLL
jgi:hypothetical protein